MKRYYVIIKNNKTTATLKEIHYLRKVHTYVTCDIDWYVQHGGITLEEYKHTFLDEIPTDWRNFKNISQAKNLVP
jgi:hypothetical protein